MLTREAIEAAVPLTQLLSGANLSVRAVTNSPLEALVKATGGVEVMPTEDPDAGKLAFMPGQLEMNTNRMDPLTQSTPHNLVMDEICAVAIKAVQEHVLFARTKVVPLVEELAQKTEEIVNTFSPSELLGMEVCIFNPPVPFVHAVFENSVKKFSDVTYDAGYRMPFVLPMLDDESLKKLLKTGSTDLDAAVETWLAGLSPDFLPTLWRDFFTNDSKLPPGLSLHGYLSGPTSYGAAFAVKLDEAIALYLMARVLLDNPPEGSGVPLQKYENAIADLRNATGACLYQANQDYYKVLSKDKILVKCIFDKCITVYGEVYKDWIAAGGDNDVLFGNLLAPRPRYTVAEIDEVKDELRNNWNRHVAVVGTAEANRRFVRVKEAMRRVFVKQMVEETDPNVNREQVFSLFEKELDMIAEQEMGNLYLIALKLVCRSRFYYTDSERILAGINAVAKENPKISVREAAAISVIDYIAYWVSSQFLVA